MRYLRMLTNAAIAGALASAYLTTLVLQLNPAYPLAPAALLPLAFTLGLAYGANLAVLFYAAIVLRQIVATEVLSPGWLSVRLLSWLCTAAATAGAAVMWLNLGTFGPVLDAGTIDRMTTGAAALSAAAATFLLLAIAHIGRRGGRLSAVVLVLTMVLSVAAPIVARGPARPGVVPAAAPPAAFAARAEARVWMLLVDGASLDRISPAVAAGQLPNFGRMLDGGASMHLATVRPTQAEPAWSAVATGRLPMANGVRSSALYRARGGSPPLTLLPDFCFAQALVRFGFLGEDAHSPASLDARPIWHILSDAGVPVGIIGWPLTHPAPEVRGYIVSDAFHRLTEAELDLGAAGAVSPAGLLPDVRAAAAESPAPDPRAIAGEDQSAPGLDPESRREPDKIAADRVHVQILDALEALAPADFTAVRLPGLDDVGHRFLRYADPTPFGDVTEEEIRQFGDVLPRYYAFVDAVVGSLLARLGPDDLLLVVSPFGMEPLTPGKRLLEQLVGNPATSGTHERAPDGFLLAYGAAVAPGRLPRGSLVDVTPTILYFLGLPVARDMDGAPRTALFTPAFTAAHPITFIPGYGR
ncbi:MAG: alkaline phosphatase family protein [Acidobacteriota bacterium]